MENQRLIDKMHLFKLPINMTPEEVDYAFDIMDKSKLELEDDLALQIDISYQHLMNYIINLKRNHTSLDSYSIEVSDIENMEIEPFIDSVYRFEILNDIKPQEKVYARKIMDKMNHDMKYVQNEDIPYTSDSIMNLIINIKRIADTLGV